MCALSSSTSAGPDEDRRRADELFAEGRQLLLVAKDPQGACKKFEAAIRLDPAATGTLLNLGLCYQDLGRFATSIGWFRKAMASAAEGIAMEAYRDAAQAAILEIAPRVSTLRFQIPGVDDVELRFDGVIVLPTAYGQFDVDAGEHAIEAKARGKRPFVATLQVREAEKLRTVVIELVDLPAIVAPALVREGGRSRATAAWILGGASLALYAVSIGYGLHLRGVETKALDDRDAAILANDPDAARRATARHDRAERALKYYDTAVVIGATIALGTGILLFVTAPKARRSTVTPIVASDQIGAIYATSF